MPDLDSLASDQRLGLDTAATNLAKEFAGTFGTETVEQFLRTSFGVRQLLAELDVPVDR